jgi:hypothetical protein
MHGSGGSLLLRTCGLAVNAKFGIDSLLLLYLLTSDCGDCSIVGDHMWHGGSHHLYRLDRVNGIGDKDVDAR